MYCGVRCHSTVTLYATLYIFLIFVQLFLYSEAMNHESSAEHARVQLRQHEALLFIPLQESVDIELTEKIYPLPQKAEADCFVPDQGKDAGRMPALHPAPTWNILVPIVRARSALAF